MIGQNSVVYPPGWVGEAMEPQGLKQMNYLCFGQGYEPYQLSLVGRAFEPYSLRQMN